ncbi:lipid II:glycine glycyltransferase FemX [Natranaerobius trueperi]|uniref:Aminoacyltransferase n=1 Tax=Natranaerobius trueperi TaxID=759412 RepID=A0A226C0H6_9FIRM|nr:peptidoglycan bridge formation glycyltransferase FemA/FemB family protein [Natranaerobius trueperi]OWZ84675.1 aminoacyltransferase [Natranaerobius trueperi]
MPILDKSNEKELARYNEFIRSSKYTHATQDINWSQVKTGWDNEQVYVERDGEIVAAMSLVIKSVIFNYSMLYAPRGPVCDITDVDLVNELVCEADKVAKKHNAFMLRFDPEVIYDENIESRYLNSGYKVRNRDKDKDDLIQPRYNMILNIQDHDEESLMSKFKSKTRYNIRLARRKGVTVTYSDSDETLDIFYKLYEDMSKRKGIGYRPYRYFKDMRDAYKGSLRIYVAEHEGDYLAAGISINYGGKVWYVYGGSTSYKRNLMASHLLQWEMIKWGLETNAHEYDFGGVFVLDNKDGLYRFKNGFCHEDGVTEFIGEFDRVYKPSIYYAFTNIVPKVQELKRKLKRSA